MGKFDHEARRRSRGEGRKGFLLHTEIRRPFQTWKMKKQSIDEEGKKRRRKKLGGKDIKKCQSPEDKFLETPPSLAPSSLELGEFFVSGKILINFDREKSFSFTSALQSRLILLTSREKSYVKLTIDFSQNHQGNLSLLIIQCPKYSLKRRFPPETTYIPLPNQKNKKV
jgi:hypothetical protein